MSNPLISVIVPCYNQAQYMDEALQSVFDQTYTNWECIIINDGSPDNTEDIAKKWVEKDNRFIYLYKENGGVSSSRNLGIEKAKGGYIQFLDADDLLATDKIAISIAVIQEHEALVVCTNYIFFQKTIAITKPPFSELGNFEFTFYNLARYWNDGFTVPIHCWLFEASLVKKNQFPIGLTAQEDWVMWLKIFREEPKTYYISKPLAFYRINLLGRTKTSGFFEETLAAIQFMKSHLNEADFQMLYEAVIRKYNSRMLSCIDKQKSIKESNTYQAGLLIKKVFKAIGLLPLSRKIFPIILKLKS